MSTISGIAGLTSAFLPMTSRPAATSGSRNSAAGSSLLQNRRSTRTAVNADVQAQVTQAFSRTAGLGSQSASSGRDQLLGQLEALDPALSSDLQALLDFIAQQNPEGAELLQQTLGLVLGHLGNQGSSGARFQPTVQAAPSTEVTGNRSERIQVALQATVTELRAELADGTEITARQIEVRFAANFESELGRADPLVLDLNGNGFETTTAYDGHQFDLLGSGNSVQAATVTGGDGLLVLDRNGNGQIDDGTELFGDQRGAADGFAELARYDDNGDGRIDANDAVYDQLAVFQDSNRNGQTDIGELQQLSDLQIAAIQLGAQAADEDSNGNRVTATSTFVRQDGTTGRVGDLLLNYLA